MNEYFAYYLEENPEVAKKIVNKALLAARARKAARAARDNVLRKGALDGMDCLVSCTIARVKTRR